MLPICRASVGTFGDRAMNRRLVLLSSLTAVSLAAAGPLSLLPARAGEPQSANVRAAMRKLWEDHITYTRNYIISALAGLQDTDEVAKRLLQNQDEIGDAVKPYYGDAAGKKLAALLKDHINIATKVVEAAKSGSKDKLSAAQDKWSANADDIAVFLGKANPNWPEKDLRHMLHKHLELTTGEVVGRLNKDWAADIKSYDEGHDHMLKFADMLTDGIAKQFPDKFNG
ncbi:hypothetical protein RFM23_23335 [Mesorhizobium abyssinicae]|uniref:Glycosyltransferase n=2 Tax=Mesorhizobium TaxID=68287 RepID=A0ABU5ATL9_9HYPH|nr:hypothetical protein [Mesorhizobium abyssinicae]MDX8540561.1 hypothetical protein [Mesorhizobium abyssinicae]